MLKKDIKLLLSDKKALLIFVLMPIVLTTILSFALKGSFESGGTTDPISIAIVKQYNLENEVSKFKGVMSHYVDSEETFDAMAFDPEKIFFDDFLNNDTLKSVMHYEVMDGDTALKAIEDENVTAVVYLEEGFVYGQYINFFSVNRNPVDIKVLTHPDYTYSGQIVTSVLQSYFDQLNEQIIAKNIYMEQAVDTIGLEGVFDNIETLVNQRSEVATLEERSISGDKPINSFTYYSIAMMSMFILYSAGFSAKEMLKEKRLLTMDRSLVAGASMTKMMASKFILTCMLASFQMVCLIVYAKLALKVDWTFNFSILIGIVFAAIAVSGIGALLGAITMVVDNYRIANIFENVLIHIFALFGGSYLPLDILPDFVKHLSYFAINRSVLDMFLAIYQGKSYLNPLLLLLGVGAVFFVAGLIIIRRKAVQLYVGID